MARNRQRARDRKLHRDNVPGELDSASAGVEEVEARIVAGAKGEPAAANAAVEAFGAEPAAAKPVKKAREPGNPVTNFLRASWAELQRVQWPDRRQVAQATAVVLGFVAIAGAYLGVADALAQRIVDAII